MDVLGPALRTPLGIPKWSAVEPALRGPPQLAASIVAPGPTPTTLGGFTPGPVGAMMGHAPAHPPPSAETCHHQSTGHEDRSSQEQCFFGPCHGQLALLAMIFPWAKVPNLPNLGAEQLFQRKRLRFV